MDLNLSTVNEFLNFLAFWEYYFMTIWVYLQLSILLSNFQLGRYKFLFQKPNPLIPFSFPFYTPD